jgi:hypothetical protein
MLYGYIVFTRASDPRTIGSAMAGVKREYLSDISTLAEKIVSLRISCQHAIVPRPIVWYNSWMASL